jgi:chemotaxis signal transduction protein
LAIRVSGDPYAIRVRELTGLLANRRVVPLPSRRPELLGVAGVRGALVSVYGLSSILGYGTGAVATKWLAMCGRAQLVALAFDELEGFLRLPQRTLFRVDSADTSRPHLAEAVRVGPTTRRVVDTPSILNFLSIDAGSPGPT